MRVGFVQFAPALGDVNGTIERLKELLPRADGVDLLVLPELCNSGYAFKSVEEARLSAESVSGGLFVDFIKEHCAHTGVYICTGLNEIDGGKLYNSAILTGPDGLIGRYRKLHLFLNEKDIFEPGDLGLPVFEVAGAKVGILICFDWQFPEAWRVLALAGADIVCHPSNLVLPGLAQRAVPQHALLNRFFVITANRIGSEGDLRFTGRSIIASPRGKVFVEAPENDDHVAVIEIDAAVARDKSVTPRNDLLADRRPECYTSLVDRD